MCDEGGRELERQATRAYHSGARTHLYEGDLCGGEGLWWSGVCVGRQGYVDIRTVRIYVCMHVHVSMPTYKYM